jgi:hypothetical protein
LGFPNDVLIELVAPLRRKPIFLRQHLLYSNLAQSEWLIPDLKQGRRLAESLSGAEKQ